MPFRPAPPGPPRPSRSPDLRIFFHGLLILRGSSNSNFCLVDVHYDPSFPHTLSIETKTKTPGKPDAVYMRHFGPLKPINPANPLGLGMTINLEPQASSPVVYSHQPSGAFDEHLGIGDDEDFRWIVNLEKLHGRSLTVDSSKTQPGITIGGGVYYFYAAQRLIKPIAVKQGGTPKPSLYAIASIIGANLYFDSGQIVLTWGADGGPNVLRLDKPQGGASHEIYINNSPLFEKPGQNHSELAEYYRVLLNVPLGEQFDLDVSSLVGDPDETEAGTVKFYPRGTPNIPCQSVVLDTPEN